MREVPRRVQAYNKTQNVLVIFFFFLHEPTEVQKGICTQAIGQIVVDRFAQKVYIILNRSVSNISCWVLYFM